VDSGERPASEDADAVPTIQDLIQRHRDRTGDSYRKIADRAHASGYPLKHQTLAELATSPPRQWPKNPDTIRALAVALGVSEGLVVIAFGRSFGLVVEQSRDALAAELSPSADPLPADIEAKVEGLVDKLVAERLAMEETRFASRLEARRAAMIEQAQPVTQAAGTTSPGKPDPDPESQDDGSMEPS